jgi:hypothetical protein
LFRFLKAQGKFMKEVAILLLVALVLNGCGTSSTTVQSASGGTWEATMSPGKGTSSGFTFITQFTVGGNGVLSISNFQFLNLEQDTCLGSSTVSENGTLNATINSANQVTGTFSFTITSGGGDVVTLTSSSVTGTLSGTTLTSGSITGTWALTPGSSSTCVATGGPFTMTQS